MRNFKGGLHYSRLDDPKTLAVVGPMYEFLLDLSNSVGNIQNGKQPNSSGLPLIGPALDDYWYLPGRSGNTVAYGGTRAAGTATIASTKHATKGKVLLGLAGTTAYDEANERFGIGTATPETRLHVVGNPQDGLLLATSDVSSDPGGWANVGFATYWQCVATKDATSYITRDFPTANTMNLVMGLATVTGTSFTVFFRAYKTGTITNDASFQFSVTNNLGDTYTATAQIIDSTLTTIPTDYSVTCATPGATGATPNVLRVTSVSPGFSSFAIVIDYTAVRPASSPGESALTIIERTASTSQPYSLWRDESDITVASITSTGAGQFQNVLLEDPGAGTGAVTLKAPSSVASWTMTLPTDDGAANEVLTTDGAGVTDWVTLGSLLDDDLEEIAALTRTRGDLIIGGASAWVGLAIGADGSAFYSNGVDPSWTLAPTWKGSHVWTRGADATAITINSFSNAGTQPLMSLLDTGAARIFGVDPSGTVSCGTEASTILDKVRFQVRAPLNQSVNVAQILLNGASRWSIGYTGKMVCTTTPPQFDTPAAAAGYLWTATDADGNADWASNASVVDIARTWTTLQTFGDYTNGNPSFVPTTGVRTLFSVDDSAVTGFIGEFRLVGALTGFNNWFLPVNGGVLETNSSTSTLTNKRLAGCHLNLGTSSVHVRFANGTSTTQYVQWDMSSLTAARTYTGPNVTGVVLLDATVIFHLDEIVSLNDEVVALIGT